MLNDTGFDKWTQNYDAQVQTDDNAGVYPFAGYKAVLDEVYALIRRHKAAVILDIGCGTGSLTKKLYNDGCEIYGIDFSQEMLKKAQAKMPEAHLTHYDLTFGLPESLKKKKFDAIVSTYTLHHFNNKKKKSLITELNSNLIEDGLMIFGDIAFETQRDMEIAREQAGEEWDEEESYFIVDEIFGWFPQHTIQFIKKSYCAGVFIISKS